MSEIIGTKEVGLSSYKEIMASTVEAEIVGVTIPGGANATYSKGVALINSATAGKVQKYTNASSATETFNGNNTNDTFDLAHSNVIASSLKAYVDGAQQDVTLSVGTGTGGVDQVIFDVAPASGTNNVKVVYDYHSNAQHVDGACILLEDVTTTTSSGDVVASALVAGSVYANKVVDSAGNAADSYFKDALKKVRFV